MKLPGYRMVAFWALIVLSEAAEEAPNAQVSPSMPPQSSISSHLSVQSGNVLPVVGDEGVVSLPTEKTTSVVSAGDDVPEDPAYAKLSADEKNMFTGQDESSHFMGDMSEKEADFAASQGAEDAMFGMSDEVSPAPFPCII